MGQFGHRDRFLPSRLYPALCGNWGEFRTPFICYPGNFNTPVHVQRDDDLDEALPPLFKHVHYLTRLSNLLGQEQEEDAVMVYDFILAQLLKIAEVQDFSDEMGRRDMLVCLRKLLSFALNAEGMSLMM